MECEQLKKRISETEYYFLMYIFARLEHTTDAFKKDDKLVIDDTQIFTIQPAVFLQREMKKKYPAAEGSILYFPREKCFEYVMQFKPIVLIDFQQSTL